MENREKIEKELRDSLVNYSKAEAELKEINAKLEMARKLDTNIRENNER